MSGTQDTPDQYNLNLVNRQIEINEWAYNSKMETVFVFQILFISMMIVALLMLMKSSGMVGGAFVYYTIAILLLIVVLIIVNRAQYSRVSRDGRHWNRRRFSEDNTASSPGKATDPAYQAYLDSVRLTYGDSKDISQICGTKKST